MHMMTRFEWCGALRCLAAGLLAACLAWTGAAVAADAARTTIPLGTGWQFSPDATITQQQAMTGSGPGWAPVSMPHSWNAADAASTAQTTPASTLYRRGIGWYRLEFVRAHTGASNWMQFDGASIVAEAWLNGVRLGAHRGAFGAFRFNLRQALKSGTNVLVVKVDNSEPVTASDPTAVVPLRGDFNMAGGLYRPVSLISTPSKVHLALGDLGSSGIFFRTVEIGPGERARVALRVKLENEGEGAAAIHQVRAVLRDARGAYVQSAQRQVGVAAATSEVDLAMTIPHARPWQGTADPYLYQLSVELADRAGTVIDRVNQPVGIRVLRFDPEQGFILNGKATPLHGVNLHQDYQDMAWAAGPMQVDESFALVREIGANTVRLAHYPHSAYTHAVADRMGLVVWAELPFVERSLTPEDCKRTSTVPDEFSNNARTQLQEMIRQHYNHPSVAMWSVANEVGMGGVCKGVDTVTPLLRKLHALAREEDPSRPTTLADFNEDVDALARIFPKFGTGGITDIWAVNRYPLWYYPIEQDGMVRMLDALHAKYPRQPIGVSEYGAGAALSHQTDNPRGGIVANMDMHNKSRVLYQPEGYASFVHEQVYAALASRPYLWGTYVWAMFDFGSGLRHEGDIGGTNTKGLVTFDRKTRKDPFYFYKANWSSEAVTHITEKRYVDRAYRVVDVKVYSNADSVRLDLNGQAVATMSAAACPLRTCVFKDVVLQPGQNTVVAHGQHGKRTVSDVAGWRLGQDNVDNVYMAAGQVATGFVSSDGHRHGSDNFFEGGQGTPLELDATFGRHFDVVVGNVPDPRDQALWGALRHGRFRYAIPVANGSYRVTLGMLEPDKDAQAGSRIFDVDANGRNRVSRLDILAEAGAPATAIWRSFEVDVNEGQLVLEFKPLAGEAVVSTIRVERR
jgi:beta-galactosidase